MNKKRIVFFSFIFLVVASLIGYRLYTNKAKTKKESDSSSSAKRGAGVYGIVVESARFADFLTLTGTVEANEVTDVRAEISGLIEAIYFTEGGHVNAGQLLVKINDSELRAQLSQAETRSVLASENERRAKLLLEKEAISQEEYDLTSADYRTAQAQKELIQAQLRKTSVLAPFSGTVGIRRVSKGSFITPSETIVQLVNATQVKLQFSIPEKYAGLIKQGMVVDFEVQGIANVFQATVYAIEPSIDPLTRTLTVRALTNNDKRQLIPGAFANVVFPLAEVNDAILVPTEALIPIQNGKKVFVQKNGRAKEIIIETGARTDSTILVTKGLNIGDTVLTSGVMSLRDGSPVKVKLK